MQPPRQVRGFLLSEKLMGARRSKAWAPQMELEAPREGSSMRVSQDEFQSPTENQVRGSFRLVACPGETGEQSGGA